MAMQSITVTRKIEVPEGATHYIGDLLDGPVFFKRTTNDTKTFDGWSVWKGRDWYLDFWEPTPPAWWNMQPIPFTEQQKAG